MEVILSTICSSASAANGEHRSILVGTCTEDLRIDASMDDTRQQKAIDSLRDWSKWLIGLDFAAVTGCVVVLQRDAIDSPFLTLAIAAFAFSVVASILVVRSLAYLIEVLPLTDANNELESIYQYRVFGSLLLGHLVYIQTGLFLAAVLFFLAWVV
jgi:hypothetical protein